MPLSSPLRLVKHIVSILATTSLLLAQPAIAQENGGLIRDAEIEHDIRSWVTPIFRAAGLDSSFVQIYLVGDQQINSFVAGGQRI
ncbi:hypothetical protein ACSTG6_23570, partial [Vibrio parahaemolyticus]